MQIPRRSVRASNIRRFRLKARPAPTAFWRRVCLGRPGPTAGAWPSRVSQRVRLRRLSRAAPAVALEFYGQSLGDVAAGKTYSELVWSLRNLEATLGRIVLGKVPVLESNRDHFARLL
jgi:hypothetical protein